MRKPLVEIRGLDRPKHLGSIEFKGGGTKSKTSILIIVHFCQHHEERRSLQSGCPSRLYIGTGPRCSNFHSKTRRPFGRPDRGQPFDYIPDYEV